jgi:ethanolamine ammonia-lyase small subunit
MQATTSARIGIGKRGPRLRTATMLQFRADHATAKDAVSRDVPDALLSQLGLFSVQTLCVDHDEYLARPDLGRRFSRETLDLISQKCRHGADVQIYAAGGLSSTAITANLANILPVMTDGLRAMNLTLGDPFFVRFARVPSMEEISETLQPKVICVLIGERPGLATAESMSAYLAYHATVGMPDSRRTVVSNIHKGGVSAAEAGAYLAELITKMIQKQQSGVDFAR